MLEEREGVDGTYELDPESRVDGRLGEVGPQGERRDALWEDLPQEDEIIVLEPIRRAELQPEYLEVLELGQNGDPEVRPADDERGQVEPPESLLVLDELRERPDVRLLHDVPVAQELQRREVRKRRGVLAQDARELRVARVAERERLERDAVPEEQGEVREALGAQDLEVREVAQGADRAVPDDGPAHEEAPQRVRGRLDCAAHTERGRGLRAVGRLGGHFDLEREGERLEVCQEVERAVVRAGHPVRACGSVDRSVRGV